MHRRARREKFFPIGVLWAMLLALALAGCDRSADSFDQTSDQLGQATGDPGSTMGAPAATTGEAGQRPSADPAAAAAGREPGMPKLKFEDGDGNEAFAIKPKDDGAKVVDGSGAELVRITQKDAKIKLKAPDDTVLGFVQGSADKYEIENPDTKSRRYAYKRQADGDLKLERGDGTRLYDVKVREQGYEIRDASGRELYKVKVKGDKTSLRKPDGITVYATKDVVSPAAVACLGFDEVPLPLRLGLFYQVQHTLGRLR